jgi:crotonobetainyl-CoA:carnitine CoA-transferase CaiB-like acyl-CoA transferase
MNRRRGDAGSDEGKADVAPAPGAAGPLAGFRILDLSRLLPGPFAARHLADWGAEVIKIESPGDGDPARHLPLSAAERTQGAGGAFFRELNDGKRQLRIDLRSPQGCEHFLELARESDAVLESFRPGVLDRLGVGWCVLHQRNPRLVLASVTGYGQVGPYASRAGHDINYIALAGILAQFAGTDGRPAIPNFQIADLLGGTLAVTSALLAALLGAQRSQLGRHVDISMTREVWRHAIVARLEGAAPDRGGPVSPDAGSGLLAGGAACYNVYRAACGRYLALGALEARFWTAFCEAVGRPEWSARHWTQGEVPGSAQARATRDEVAALLATRTSESWLALTDPADCCVTPILRMQEVAAHPWFGG